MDNRGSINDINGISRPAPRRPLVTPSRATNQQARPQSAISTTSKKPATPVKPIEPLMPTRPAAPLVHASASAKTTSSSRPWIILTIVMTVIAVVALGYIFYTLLQSE